MTAVKGPTGSCDRDEAFTRLVSQYQGALLRMCSITLRDRSAAEDAVQETFLKAYKHMDTFRSESKERTWLMSIAINTCRDMNRSAWFRHTDKRITPEDMSLAAPHQDEDALALAEAIRHLPARHRDVILLYYYQDMTIREVAEALHAAPSTILKRIKQAQDKLRAALDGQASVPAAGKEVFR